MKIAAMVLKTDTSAVSHYANPTTPIASPVPYQASVKIGLTVRKAEDTDWPMPWTVPSTVGRGEQLFRRMIEVGSVKVRAATCRNKTIMMENHTHGPLA